MGAGHAHALYVHEHSLVHHLDPEVKVASAVVFVAAVAVTPRHAVWAFAIDLVAIGAVLRVARVPARFALSRLAIVVPFVLFALLVPFVATGERVELLGVSVSREGLWGSFNVLAKAGLGALASITLAATTEVPNLLRGIERLGVPAVFATIAAFMVRYLEVLAGEVRRLQAAMRARAFAPRWIGDAAPVAAAAGTLFVRSYERSERIHQAMLARGFTGTMPELQARPRGSARWLAAVPLPAIAVTCAIVAAVTS